MKTHKISCQPCRMPQWDDAGVKVKNMRRCGNSGLAPVGIPASRCAAGSGIMIAAVGSSTVFLDGRTVRVSASGAVKNAGTLPGIYRCHSVSAAGVTFMTDVGAWRLSIAGDEVTIDDFTAEYPKLRVGVYATRRFSAATSPRSLSGDYTRWTGPFTAEDRSCVSADLISAYAGAVRSGMAAGYYTQPVAVWYRLLDDRGQLLYRSEPAVVSSGGYGALGPFTADVALAGGCYRNLSAVQVALDGFSIGFRAPAPSTPGNCPAVASAEIYVSPMLDPVDYSGEATLTAGESTALEARLGLRLPLLAGLKPRVIRLLERLESAGSRVAVVQDPFSGEYSSMRLIDTADVVDPRRSSSALSSLLSKPAAVTDLRLSEIALPHRFSAGAVTMASDMAVWGDIKPVMALPGGVGWCHAAADDGVAWSAVTRVTLSRGGCDEVVALEESGASGCPVSLSAVVGYPHPSATRLQVTVTGSDGSRRGVDLKLEPSGTGAFYVSPGLKPVALEEGASPLSPVTKRCGVSSPSAVAVCSAGNELSPVMLKNILSGRITALAESPRYGNSLDIGRRHICLFATSGLYISAINLRQRSMSCHLLDSLAVESPQAVAVTPAGVYAATGSGTLVRVDGGKVKCVAQGCGFVAAGYSPQHGELLCLDREGRMMAMDSSGGWAFRELPERVIRLCAHQGALFAVGSETVFDLNDESPGDMAVSYSAAMRDRSLPAGIARRVLWLFGASRFRGTLSVAASGNDVDETTVARFSVDGRVNQPPVTVIPVCRYRCVRLSAEGVISSDGVMNEIIMD